MALVMAIADPESLDSCSYCGAVYDKDLAGHGWMCPVCKLKDELEEKIREVGAMAEEYRRSRPIKT